MAAAENRGRGRGRCTVSLPVTEALAAGTAAYGGGIQLESSGIPYQFASFKFGSL